jgi:hypothetical protein
VESALYLPDEGRFVPTDLTRSPWHPGAQHGGPPAALAVGAIEAAAPEGMEITRISVDVLGEIPVEPLTVEASVPRPGRRVMLTRAEVAAAGRPLMTATAWLMRRTELPLPPPADPLPAPPPVPGDLPAFDSTFRDYADFYGSALDKRLIDGSVEAPGRAAMWFRLRVPVVAGRPDSPLQRLAAIADSGNGISWSLPFEDYLFTNTDLTLSVVRAPQGEWFALDAVTHLDAGGRGIADTLLFDEGGWLGRGMQSLYVAERTER